MDSTNKIVIGLLVFLHSFTYVLLCCFYLNEQNAITEPYCKEKQFTVKNIVIHQLKTLHSVEHTQTKIQSKKYIFTKRQA